MTCGQKGMERSLQPELLDHLAPTEPAAQHSRRDLRIINRAMGNTSWLHERLVDIVRPGERVLEVGAGEGDFARYCGGGGWDGLDLWPRPATWPRRSRWHQTDILEFEGWADYPVIFASLFFHQFSEADLGRLGERLRAHARVIIACEPVRDRKFQKLFAALCAVIGAGAVTRHDGHVSIAAGFRDDELPRLLGLGAGWKCRLEQTWRGAYRFIAVRA